MAANNLRRLIQEAVTKEVDIPTSFLGDLKRTVIQEAIKHDRKPSKTYKPSSLKCIRNMYFQMTEAETDPLKPNPSLVGMGESGTDRHVHIQRYITKMKKHDIDCEYISVKDYIEQMGLTDLEVVSESGYETKVEHKTLKLRFLTDGIVKYKGKYYVLEIKTETSYKWQSRTDVADEHLNQGITYATAFGLDEVLYLYENRDLCDWKVFILKVNKEMKEELITKPIAESEKYVAANKVPPLPKTISKKLCQYCPYTMICKKTGETEAIE